MLLVVGALALRAPKRRRSPHPRLGEAYFWLLIVALPSGLVVGARHPELSAFEIATVPTLAMGIGGFAMAKLRPRRFLGESWLVWHISGQGGSYIGVWTATLFQIVPRLAPESAVTTALIWALPTVVGTALIVRATSRLPAPPKVARPSAV